MDEDTWIVFPNWEKHQSYKARQPGWIKVYTELNSRDDWLGLTWGQRGVLVTLWVEYARARGKLRPEMGRNLASKWSVKTTLRHIEALNHAGFLDLIGPLEVEKKDKEERNDDGLIHIREIQERLNRQ